jgi:hypothetical protein
MLVNTIEGFPPVNAPTLEGALETQAKMTFHRILADIMHRDEIPGLKLKYEPTSFKVGNRFYEALTMVRPEVERTFHMIMHQENEDPEKVAIVFVITKKGEMKSRQAFEFKPELWQYTSYTTVEFFLQRNGEHSDKTHIEKILAPIYKDVPEEFTLKWTQMAKERSMPIVGEQPETQGE